MAPIETKLVENALINLYYAEADLMADDSVLERRAEIRLHILKAESCLRVLAPEFMGMGDDPVILRGGDIGKVA